MHATRLSVAAALSLALAACTEPVPPDKQQPPEPQAPRSTELRDAIHAPVHKAQAVDAQVQDAARQQQAAIDAQTGG